MLVALAFSQWGIFVLKKTPLASNELFFFDFFFFIFAFFFIDFRPSYTVQKIDKNN